MGLIEGYKRCSKGENCVHPDGPMLPATTDFFYYRKDQGRLQACCKLCHLAKTRERARRWNKENPERFQEIQRHYRDTHRGAINNRRRLYYAQNKERLTPLRKQQSQRYYQRNRERILPEQRRRSKEYYAQNREKVINRVRLYRERMKTQEQSEYPN